MTYLLLSLLQEAYFLLFIWLGNFFTLTFLASSLKRPNKVSKKLLSFFVSFRRRRFCVLIPLLEGKTLSFLRPCSVKLLNCRPRDIFVLPHFNFDPERQKNMSSAEFSFLFETSSSTDSSTRCSSLREQQMVADSREPHTHSHSVKHNHIHTHVCTNTDSSLPPLHLYTVIPTGKHTHTHTRAHTQATRRSTLNMDEHMWMWESVKKQTTSSLSSNSQSEPQNLSDWQKHKQGSFPGSEDMRQLILGIKERRRRGDSKASWLGSVEGGLNVGSSTNLL